MTEKEFYQKGVYRKEDTKSNITVGRKIKSILLVILIIVFGIWLRNKIVELSYPSVSDPYETINDLNHLTKDTKKLAMEFLIRCEEEDLPVKVVETYRTPERQELLYNQGRNAEGPVVTWTKESVHTKRRAFDICKRGDNPYGDEEFFRRCAEIGEEVGLTAGYYWEVKDGPHFENYKWDNKFIY